MKGNTPMAYPTKVERDAARKVLEQITEHGTQVLGKLADHGVGRDTLAALSIAARVLGRDPDMFFKAMAVEMGQE